MRSFLERSLAWLDRVGVWLPESDTVAETRPETRQSETLQNRTSEDIWPKYDDGYSLSSRFGSRDAGRLGRATIRSDRFD